jgi:squalene-hopene/tetraprenyl-beta-curcumene cyclase
MDLSDVAHFEETLSNARQALLDAREPSGHWEGELSSSALSTATAVFTLSLYRAQHPESGHGALITRGLDWLAAHQNSDGGWGDTVKSFSNISTTALCWAALASSESKADYGATVYRAEVCLIRMSSDFRRPPLTESAVDKSRVLPPLPPGEGRGEGEFQAPLLERATSSAASPHPSPLPEGEGVRRVEPAINVDPTRLIPAIIKRYGKDHTFSVPILTMCALAGRLGTGRDAWRRIPQLPFELAAFPQRWFKWLKLPVVSYALPALIAIGLVRHHNRPTRNPVALLARRLARGRALRLLERIQPTTGGYLEATPLTSFVVMSLVGAGLADSPVVSRGIEFLVHSARADGSWAIDTNLATWVTTLSVNALSIDPEFQGIMPEAERRTIRDWLLDQQNTVEHPYTLADRGGWAWTNLNGGVPDADDTAGALLALHRLGIMDERTVRAAEMGARWLMNLQNRDFGMPTFCKGWGKLPFDRSSFDLTAHALRAWHAWSNDVPASFRRSILVALYRPTKYLLWHHQGDVTWVPLWFGNQHAPDDENPTYGTAKVLCAADCFRPGGRDSIDWSLLRGINWLLRAQNADGGWGGDVATPSTIEETAIAIEGLATASGTLFDPAGVDLRVGETPSAVPSEDDQPDPAVTEPRCVDAIRRGVEWLIEHTDRGRSFDPSPIGFYFAKLWYFEKLYPVIFTVAALNAVKRFERERNMVTEVTTPADGEKIDR